jgi:transposase-like protein
VQTSGPTHSVRSAPLSTRQWRVGDRLSEADTEQLVAAFTAGTSKRKLAERYGISESSVKRLIRQHGASKPSNGLPAPVAISTPKGRLQHTGQHIIHI